MVQSCGNSNKNKLRYLYINLNIYIYNIIYVDTLEVVPIIENGGEPFG